MYSENKSKIAKQLIDYESPIQLSSEWERLEKRLHKEKRRRLFFILLPIAVVASIASFFLFNALKQVDSLAVNQKNVHSKTTSKYESNKDQSSSFGKSFKSKIEKTYGRTSDIATSNPDLSNIQTKPNTSIALQGINQIINTNSDLAQSNININKEKTIDQKATSTEISSLINENPTSDDLVISSAMDKESYALNNDNETNSKNDLTPIFINKIALLYPSLSYEKTNVQSLPLKPIVYKHRNKIWIDASMSIGKPIIKYTEIASEANQLVLLKKSAERALENLQWNVLVGKNLYNGFYLKSGLQYSRTNDVISTSIKDTTTTFIPNSIIGVYTNHEGITQTTIGTLKKITINEIDINKYGSNQSLNLALFVGKNFEFIKSKWCIEVGAGLPLWRSYKGQTLTSFNQIQPKAGVYTNDKKWSYITSLQYQYPLYKFLYLSGGYTFTYHKLSTNLDFSNTTNVHSFTVGLRYFIH